MQSASGIKNKKPLMKKPPRYGGSFLSLSVVEERVCTFY